jgi:hypothetical protein
MLQAKSYLTKPVGVRLISIFSLIVGTFGILSGVIILMFGHQLVTLLIDQGNLSAAQNLQKVLTESGVVVGIAPIILGGLTLVTGYGLYRIHKWSWVFQIVISAVYIYIWLWPGDNAFDYEMGIFFVVSYSIIISYLCKRNIRQYFHSVTFCHIPFYHIENT